MKETYSVSSLEAGWRQAPCRSWLAEGKGANGIKRLGWQLPRATPASSLNSKDLIICKWGGNLHSQLPPEQEKQMSTSSRETGE